MDIEKLFVPDGLNDGMRLCGTCGQVKPVSEFYKDGKDRKTGKPKYRRDCKECYKATRLLTDKMKENRR